MPYPFCCARPSIIISHELNFFKLVSIVFAVLPICSKTKTEIAKRRRKKWKSIGTGEKKRKRKEKRMFHIATSNNVLECYFLKANQAQCINTITTITTIVSTDASTTHHRQQQDKKKKSSNYV